MPAYVSGLPKATLRRARGAGEGVAGARLPRRQARGGRVATKASSTRCARCARRSGSTSTSWSTCTGSTRRARRSSSRRTWRRSIPISSTRHRARRRTSTDWRRSRRGPRCRWPRARSGATCHEARMRLPRAPLSLRPARDGPHRRVATPRGSARLADQHRARVVRTRRSASASSWRPAFTRRPRCSNCPYHEYQHSVFDRNLEHVDTTMRCAAGFYTLPGGPGLGVEPRRSLERFRLPLNVWGQVGNLVGNLTPDVIASPPRTSAPTRGTARAAGTARTWGGARRRPRPSAPASRPDTRRRSSAGRR